MAIEVALHVPELIVPRFVKLLLPFQVLNEVFSTLFNPKLALASVRLVAPVPPFSMAIEVALHVPELIVPSFVKLLLPFQVLNEVFSTLLNPTFDLLIPVAILASVTASSRMRYVLTGNKSKVVVTNGNPPLFSLGIDVVV